MHRIKYTKTDVLLSSITRDEIKTKLKYSLLVRYVKKKYMEDNEMYIKKIKNKIKYAGKDEK